MSKNSFITTESDTINDLDAAKILSSLHKKISCENKQLCDHLITNDKISEDKKKFEEALLRGTLEDQKNKLKFLNAIVEGDTKEVENYLMSQPDVQNAIVELYAHHLAAELGQLEILKYFYNNCHRNIFIQPKINGDTLLHSAARSNNLDLVVFVTEYIVISPKHKNSLGLTALDISSFPLYESDYTDFNKIYDYLSKYDNNRLIPTEPKDYLSFLDEDDDLDSPIGSYNLESYMQLHELPMTLFDYPHII